MQFVSYTQLLADLQKFERTLPEFDMVCGVPRSGMIAASYLALQRNVRLVSLDSLLCDQTLAMSFSSLRFNNPSKNENTGNKLLIVDDSCSDKSVTMTELREKLKVYTDLDIRYAAVYRASPESKVDFYFREIPMPRLFQWNWLRHRILSETLFDMDGVLCEDPAFDESAEPEKFLEHIANARPLYLPKIKIRGIVTSRLEKYRKQTEAWLLKHKLRYGFLLMHPAKTPQERRAAKNHGKVKAESYRKDLSAKLFVESDSRQAQEIFNLTQRPVLCPGTMVCLSS